MKTYLTSLLILIVLGVSSVSAILGVRYWGARDINLADERQGQLLAYQESKILELAPDSIDTVLIGDSTLGNAIDVGAFGAQTRTRSVSLALTGSFGYGAGLHQLKSLMTRQSKIRNVVLFYSVDAMASGLLPEGYFFSSPVPDLTLPLRDEIALLRTYAQRLLDGPAAAEFLLRGVTGKLSALSIPPSLQEEDYVISRGIITMANTEAYRIPQQIQLSSLVFLQEIARLCGKKGWNCIYVHGPVLATSVAASSWASRYFAEADKAIEKAGIRFAGGPLLMENDDRGDTVFHVRFDRRLEFTSRYADLLKAVFQQTYAPPRPR